MFWYALDVGNVSPGRAGGRHVGGKGGSFVVTVRSEEMDRMKREGEFGLGLLRGTLWIDER